MPQSRGTMFDDFSQLMTDAAEMAHGVRREAETMFKAQVERLLASMDLVTREEFEAARDMIIAARDENERLAKRIAALEAKLALQGESGAASASSSDPAF
jgi:BMFP domain-containing protein YqiC